MEARRAALEGEVAEFRRLAAADADHLYPGLAIALADLSSVLRDLDRRDEALQAAQEASELFHVLADHDDRFRRHHSMSLNNLSARLQDAGMTTEALEASRAAVDAAAGLAQDEDGTPFILGAARLNMATQLFILGGVREGTAVLCEIGRTIRRMIEAGQSGPAGGQLDILRQLAEQALGRRDWPLHVGLRRALMLALPGEGAPGRAGLARALDEAAAAVADDDPETALAWAEEAATEFARLAGEEPARFSAAAAMVTERWLRLACGNHEVAERAARALATAAAPASDQYATALTVLTMALEGQARFDEALAAVDDAVAAWRSLPGDRRRRLRRYAAPAGRTVDPSRPLGGRHGRGRRGHPPAAFGHHPRRGRQFRGPRRFRAAARRMPERAAAAAVTAMDIRRSLPLQCAATRLLSARSSGCHRRKETYR